MFEVDEVRFETNGRLTVSRRGDRLQSYLLVNNGAVLESSLRAPDRPRSGSPKISVNWGTTRLRTCFVSSGRLRRDFTYSPKTNRMLRREPCPIR